MSTDDATNVTKRLRAVQNQYRRKHLQQRLDDIAEELEILYLRKELYESLLEVTIEIDPELQSLIKKTRESVNEGDFENVESTVDSLEDQISDYNNNIEQKVTGKLETRRSNIDSIKKLNQRLGKLSSEKIDETEGFYAPGNMVERIELDTDSSLDEKIETVRSTANRYKDRYDEMVAEIFEPYLKSEYGDKVTEMMSDDPPSLDAFDDEELGQLRDSDLSPHIELRFG